MEDDADALLNQLEEEVPAQPSEDDAPSQSSPFSVAILFAEELFKQELDSVKGLYDKIARAMKSKVDLEWKHRKELPPEVFVHFKSTDERMPFKDADSHWRAYRKAILAKKLEAIDRDIEYWRTAVESTLAGLEKIINDPMGNGLSDDWTKFDETLNSKSLLSAVSLIRHNLSTACTRSVTMHEDKLKSSDTRAINKASALGGSHPQSKLNLLAENAIKAALEKCRKKPDDRDGNKGPSSSNKRKREEPTDELSQDESSPDVVETSPPMPKPDAPPPPKKAKNDGRYHSNYKGFDRSGPTSKPKRRGPPPQKRKNPRREENSRASGRRGPSSTRPNRRNGGEKREPTRGPSRGRGRRRRYPPRKN